MNKLPADFKKKWTEALLSGDYEQSSEVLKGSSGYCCLGVACDIYKDASWMYGKADNWYTQNEAFDYPKRGDLPNDVYDVLQQGDHSIMRRLAIMNDAGMSFVEIAQWIEENL